MEKTKRSENRKNNLPPPPIKKENAANYMKDGGAE